MFNRINIGPWTAHRSKTNSRIGLRVFRVYYFFLSLSFILLIVDATYNLKSMHHAHWFHFNIFDQKKKFTIIGWYTFLFLLSRCVRVWINIWLHFGFMQQWCLIKRCKKWILPQCNERFIEAKIQWVYNYICPFYVPHVPATKRKKYTIIYDPTPIPNVW